MIDFSPLFRNAIGFDRLANTLEHAHRSDAGGYPPYNIELAAEDQYRITMAVAGFSDDEVELVVHQNILKVTGARKADQEDRTYLHRGIANRSFERSFQLADHVQITGAELKNGLLNIELKREVPEAMKPRRIKINQDSVIGSQVRAA